MPSDYTELQLDALRELANIGAGTAATALSQMLGQEVALDVPRAHALPFGFMLVPISGSVDTLLAPLGLAEPGTQTTDRAYGKSPSVCAERVAVERDARVRKRLHRVV